MVLGPVKVTYLTKNQQKINQKRRLTALFFGYVFVYFLLLEVAFDGVEDDGIASTFPPFLQYPCVDDVDGLLFFCCPVVRDV